jgi:hypothetical protein
MSNNILKPIIRGTRPATGLPPHKNIEWLKHHHQEYHGQWVALEDGALFNASKDLLELYRLVKNADKLRTTIFINLKIFAST